MIRDQVLKDLRRKGIVVGLSGGIDSSVVAALSAQALGKDRVLALSMPECESSESSQRWRTLSLLILESVFLWKIFIDSGSNGCLQKAGRDDPHRNPGIWAGLQVQDRLAWSAGSKRI